MSSVYETVSDILILNDKNAVDYGATDLLIDAPLTAVLAATPASDGTFHKYLKVTGVPTTAFRQAYAGKDNSKSTTVAITVALSIWDGSFAVDQAVADSYIKGGADAFNARELNLTLQGGMFKFETQIINGTTLGDAGGFTGLADVLNALANPMVLSAGGSTANAMTSVYAIRTNDNGTDVMAVIGNGGRIDVEPTVSTPMADVNGKTFPAYFTPVKGWMGMQFGSIYSCGRLANIDTSTGSTHKLTDALLDQLYAKFPAGRKPTQWAMNRAALAQLQQSRTSFSPTGAPALLPDSAVGVPIIVTDAVLNTEPVIS